MKRLHKVEQIGLICSFLLISSASLAQTQPKSWLLMADGQYRDSDVISHSGGVTGSFGRSRTGAELIYQDADRAVDLEWYRYEHSFAGAVAGTDRSYGNTQDLILSGFRQWQLSDKYAGQIIYGLELAAEESIGLEEGFRWGLGGALRWQPDAETDVALGLMFQDRFENSILPVPYVKAFWRPCRYAEVELRATGLQNGVIFRGFPTGDRATTVDLLVAYETLNFPPRRRRLRQPRGGRRRSPHPPRRHAIPGILRHLVRARAARVGRLRASQLQARRRDPRRVPAGCDLGGRRPRRRPLLIRVSARRARGRR
jgi:hypothetical protein